MSRPDSEKCCLRSKLSTQEAQDRHGATGALLRRYCKGRCWEDQRCHNRRSYYRHRGVRNHPAIPNSERFCAISAISRNIKNHKPQLL